MKTRRPITPETALLRLQALCSCGEQCSFDLLRKMSQWGLSAPTAMEILKKLEDDRFVSDRRYSSAFARDKARFSYWGKYKIGIVLSQKKIKKEYIREALDSIDERDYINALRTVIDRKIKQAGNDAYTYEGRTKIFRSVAMKGYEPALISKILRNRGKDEVEEIDD